MNSTFENVANNMLPTTMKLLITIGITVCLLSIVVAIYAYAKKEYNKKMTLKYLTATFLIGAMVSMSGILINFIVNFNIDFTTFKIEIPASFIISLVVFFLIIKVKNDK